MFCSKCGKETPNASGICDECLVAETASSEVTLVPGKGKGIASLILGICGMGNLICAILAIVLGNKSIGTEGQKLGKVGKILGIVGIPVSIFYILISVLFFIIGLMQSIGAM